MKSRPNENYPAWSDAKFWSFVRSGLRRKWVMWPCRFEAIKKARKAVKGKKYKWLVKCAKCKRWKKMKEIQVDHITPVGSLKRYEDLPGFVRRLFVPTEKLRVLCKPCHNKVTYK